MSDSQPVEHDQEAIDAVDFEAGAFDAFGGESIEPSDAEILAAALDEDELDLLQIDVTDELVANEVDLVADDEAMSAEEAAIHII
jgi:hypothetical protein